MTSPDDRRREKPSDRFDTSIMEINLDEIAEKLDEEEPVHDEEQPHRQIELFRHEGKTVSLMELDSGAHIPEHRVEDGVVVIQILEGKLCFQSDPQDHHDHYEQRDMLFLEPDTPHSVQAETDCRFLLTIMR
jgi:quercetin dioxygenase-like cupin family protein